MTINCKTPLSAFTVVSDAIFKTLPKNSLYTELFSSTELMLWSAKIWLWSKNLIILIRKILHALDFPVFSLFLIRLSINILLLTNVFQLVAELWLPLFKWHEVTKYFQGKFHLFSRRELCCLTFLKLDDVNNSTRFVFNFAFFLFFQRYSKCTLIVWCVCMETYTSISLKKNNENWCIQLFMKRPSLTAMKVLRALDTKLKKKDKNWKIR